MIEAAILAVGILVGLGLAPRLALRWATARHAWRQRCACPHPETVFSLESGMVTCVKCHEWWAHETY